MKIELSKYYNTFFSLIAAIATMLLMGCGAKKGSNSSEERETAGTSKEVQAKWQQESLHLMKELQAIKVTSKGTGNKRNVILFADSTLEKARAAAHRLFPVLSGKAKADKKDSNAEIIVSSGQSEGYLEEAILSAVGEYAAHVQSNISSEDNGSKITEHSQINIGPYKFYRYTLAIDGFLSENIKSKFNREYKVEGPSGSLIARYVEDEEDLATISVQQNGLSIVDFVGGLLEEGNNLYTIIICAEEMGSEFLVYLIHEKKNEGE